MENSAKRLTFIWSIVVLVASVQHVIIAAAPPRITPNDEHITLILNQHQTITCTHSEQIVWIVPEDADSSFYHISENEPAINGSRTHKKSITINYKTKQDPAQTIVGSYYCLSQSLAVNMSHERLNALFLERKASRIFVYLKDADIKLARSQYSTRITTTLNSTVYFPCWPTDESLKMSILSDDEPDGIFYEPILHLGAKLIIATGNGFTDYKCVCDGDELYVRVDPIEPPDYVAIETYWYQQGYPTFNGELNWRCVSHPSDDNFIYKWTYPSKRNLISNKDWFNVSNLTKSDEGIYECTVTNPKLSGVHASKSAQRIAQIIDETLSIDFAHVRTTEFSVGIYENLKINIRMNGSLNHKSGTWHFPVTIAERRINESTVVEGTIRTDSLVIEAMKLSESGNYTFSVLDSSRQRANVTIQVSITTRPEMSLSREEAFPPNENVAVECEVVAFPVPTVTWFIRKCTLQFYCNSSTVLEDGNVNVIRHSAYNATYVLTLNLSEPAILRVEAKNDIDVTSMNYLAYVMEQPDHVWQIAPEDFFEGMPTTLECFISKYKCRNMTNWEFDKVLLVNDTILGVGVYNEELEFMYKSTLSLSKLNSLNEGRYKCLCPARYRVLEEMSTETPELFLQLQKPVPLTVKYVAFGLVLGRGPLWMQCIAEGKPIPIVTWYKNNQLLTSNEHIVTTNTSLSIQSPNSDDLGAYECRAENFFESTTHTFEYQKEKNTSLIYTVLGSVILTIVLVLLAVWIVLYRKDYKKKQALKEYFLVGNSKQINPDMSISDQADVLPYDTQYDFSADKLEMGILIGAGAFGTVLKAEATGIVEGEPRTTVAVKRVNHPGQDDQLMMLIAEMKIMIHIGRHKNIVSLLGVVHEHLISKGELLVITGFCSFGNLHDFVLRNRANFLDQIDPNTKEIVSSRQETSNALYSNIACNTTSCDPTLNIGSAEDDIKSENPGHTITTSDLVCWSYQISQGMNYLASKGVLHGDLAARNMLLAEENVVKIADFGLSRKLLPEEDYQKESSTAVPLKWLAIESINSKVFNSSSDVWSFGVIMWELFSLSEVPYVNIKNEDLLASLLDGYRLGCPKYATSAIYEIMLKCWVSEPQNRPRFNALGKSLSVFMAQDLVQKFEDKSAVYVPIDADKSYRYSQMIEIPPMLTTLTNIDQIQDQFESIPLHII